MTCGLGGNLRIISFGEWNYSFLITVLRHAGFLQSSRFIDQAAASGSGDPVLPRHFRQAQTGKAVAHNCSPFVCFCTVLVQSKFLAQVISMGQERL